MGTYAGPTAAFKINGTASSTRGYDATNDEAITLQLETSPAPGIYRIQFSVHSATDPESPLASLDAPDLTLSPSTGIPATPTGTVTTTMPSIGDAGVAAHSYIVRCVINNGAEAATGHVIPQWTSERIIAIRTATGIRKPIPGETTQYTARGWTDELSRIADIPAGTPAGPATTDLTGSYPGPNVVRVNGQRVPWKATVRAVCLSQTTLSGSQTCDGVALVAGDRALTTAQTLQHANRIWTVAAGAWTSGTDMAASADLLPGSCVRVTEGTRWGGTQYCLHTPSPDGGMVLGSTALRWEPSDTEIDLLAMPHTYCDDAVTADDDGFDEAIAACGTEAEHPTCKIRPPCGRKCKWTRGHTIARDRVSMVECAVHSPEIIWAPATSGQTMLTFSKGTTDAGSGIEQYQSELKVSVTCSPYNAMPATTGVELFVANRANITVTSLGCHSAGGANGTIGVRTHGHELVSVNADTPKKIGDLDFDRPVVISRSTDTSTYLDADFFTLGGSMLCSHGYNAIAVDADVRYISNMTIQDISAPLCDREFYWHQTRPASYLSTALAFKGSHRHEQSTCTTCFSVDIDAALTSFVVDDLTAAVAGYGVKLRQVNKAAINRLVYARGADTLDSGVGPGVCADFDEGDDITWSNGFCQTGGSGIVVGSGLVQDRAEGSNYQNATRPSYHWSSATSLSAAVDRPMLRGVNVTPETVTAVGTSVIPTLAQGAVPDADDAAGQPMAIMAQAGQAQKGDAGNTNGGGLILSGGLPGTGGAGAAGTPGSVTLAYPYSCNPANSSCLYITLLAASTNGYYSVWGTSPPGSTTAHQSAGLQIDVGDNGADAGGSLRIAVNNGTATQTLATKSFILGEPGIAGPNSTWYSILRSASGYTVDEGTPNNWIRQFHSGERTNFFQNADQVAALYEKELLGDNQTVLVLLWKDPADGGTAYYRLVGVSVGAVNSCGSARCLTVPN